ncbi:putative nucleotide-diphospho-sugar transferase [Marinirhabdus gelatinilytica]|uniref:Nucleotide-diphospho-sugar transferase n=1 Tax=Marinirhabdus gelatinilytica TaxID=1703343 RepID=A0A370Q8W4_9FLAO|nr:putative nucleotide-diphospho-sugar transferase [Marinirhabdus gelatinilytica]RDK84806.1 nucleotide-diphospho-sugar transferase [Marinirhabdus gelatinilytica]
MNVCILSGRYPVTEFQSYINHKIYADHFGYSYVHCNWPTTTKNNYLNKIVYILSIIDHYDYLVWIDDDAFFIDFKKDIMEYRPEGDSFISFCKSPNFKELKTVLSSGQFIVRVNDLSKLFFETVLKTEMDSVKNWWDESLGYFTNGDQDIMIYLLLEDKRFKNKVDLYDYKKFNSRVENLIDVDVHKPLVLHFTGRGKTKQKNYIRIQRNLNIHPSLVPNTKLVEYNIVVKPSYNKDDVQKNPVSLLYKLNRKIKGWL